LKVDTAEESKVSVDQIVDSYLVLKDLVVDLTLVLLTLFDNIFIFDAYNEAASVLMNEFAYFNAIYLLLAVVLRLGEELVCKPI
jgi:hypothetical protein